MTYKKNEEYEIEITDIGTEGEGIGHLNDGYTLFVQGALPGDHIRAHIIKAQKKYGIARLMEILRPSVDRVTPLCPLAGRCGGCQLMSLSYDAQLKFKMNKVRELLVRVGGFDAEYVNEIFEGIIACEPDLSYYDYGSDESVEGSQIDVSTENTSVISVNINGNKMRDKVGMNAPLRYRNKAQYPVGTDKDGHIVTGFYAPRTHRIVPCADCLIGAPTDAPILKCIRDFMTEYGVSAYDENTREGLVRHILIRTGYATGEIQVCVVINGDKIPHTDELIKRLCEVKLHSTYDDMDSSTPSGQSDALSGRSDEELVVNNECISMKERSCEPRISSICVSINTDDTNVILGDNYTALYGKNYITDKIGDLSFRISPLSFYQVNPFQTYKLYAKALEYAALTGHETVWDLYCGIGTISLFLARAAGEVYGIEIVSQAIEDARANAQLNGIDNAAFYVGKVEEVLPGRYPDPDVIVVDPPRKGCDVACLDTMLKLRPDRIVYISCDPATLARDLKHLCADGTYVLSKVCCADMFVSSGHVETVTLLHMANPSANRNQT